MTEQLPPELRELPSASKLVYRTIEHEAPITYTGLSDRTGLTDAGLNYALKPLREHNHVERTNHPNDARKKLYVLTK